MPRPSSTVLDRFVVPDDVHPLPGGQGGTVRAGDLALSPDRDARVLDWLAPVQARLAYELDLEPGRRPLRLVMPVPARDGDWVVQGWAATRFEPGAVPCHDLDVVLAAGRLLHAHLASAVPQPPPVTVADPPHRWDRAEALAFGPAADLLAVADDGSAVAAIARALGSGDLDPADLGPSQLVHRDLASNVLLDARGSALVIDLTPTWRPVLWADAVCVLDSVTWYGAAPSALDGWRVGAPRQAMLRALAFRLLSDDPVRPEAYASALAAVGVGEA